MLTPIVQTFAGSSKRLISSASTTASSGPAARPPNSTGHVMAAHPPSASVRCQCFAFSTAAGSSSKPDSTEMRSVASVRSRRVLLEPRSRLGAELRLARRIVEVHYASLLLAKVGGPAKHCASSSHATAPAPQALSAVSST